mmetsp:Transcript_5637/g.4033  ORF Transcript_5637/g.4033 Transcript_5637/m.4033 type:complete len:123 (-) Transcript_5637:569-937(-)|eukprot:CAMPEP_0116881136 /NCGR_PEP_ID=MMETSP0463-20121206/13220_1 /TAXON_ID=181622 /ORGANISM="Strombidinopsis sp, Strain SopsisLIS2011" /LENGTH=122 /DNA_ID=CAMNT_0004532723 /DNA_START=640 /DNA_END=1008 /DNA_ORIENTATION=-
MGLKGEYIVDDTVFISKTHHPGKAPYSIPLTVNKVLFIARNPFDVMISFACFCVCMNHSVKPKFTIHEEYPEWWDKFVKMNCRVMKKFFAQIIKEAESGKYDVCFVRYEDIVSNKQKELERI